MNIPDPVVALTQALVKVGTVNPPGHEDTCIGMLVALLSSAGCACRTHALAPRCTSLVARIGSRSSKQAPLAFTGPVDAVPLGAAHWSHDPFGAANVEGHWYGRGSTDLKSGVAAFTTAAIASADRMRDGPGCTPITTAGEETGCDGALAMSRAPDAAEPLGRAGALVVAEPTGNAPLLGHKAAFWPIRKASGVTAHGSMPERGDNAVYKIARAALALERFEFEEEAHALMGEPTLDVGTMQGAMNINSAPDAAKIAIDIRSVAGQDHANVLRCLCRVLGDGIALGPRLDVASVCTEPQDPWMQRVFALCTASQGGGALEHRTISCFTNAAALRPPWGMPPIVILGPGEPELAHQTDECCRVDCIGEAHELFVGLIDDWRAAASP